MLRRFAAALVLLAGCGPDRVFDPVQVDIAANCDRAEVIVTYDDFDDPSRPWNEVLAAASDAPGLRSVWLLVEFDGDDGVPRLGLWHLTEDTVDAQVTLDLVPNEADTLELLPGAAAGVLWMLRRRGDEFYVARIERTTDQQVNVVQSGDFGSFPPVSSGAIGCDEDQDGEPDPCNPRAWPKHLAIAGGVPFLVTAPAGTTQAVTHAFVGGLDQNLNISELAELQFTRQCDITAPLEELAFCTSLNERTSYPEITISGVQRDPTDATWSMFLLRNAAIDGIPEVREPIVLTIGLQDNGSPQGVLRAQSGEATAALRAIVGPPSDLAIDEFNSFLLHATASDGPRLVRVSNVEASFEDIEGLELSDRTQLLQLEGDIALGEIAGDTWRVTKLFPDAPERSQTTEFTADAPIRRVTRAGPGSFLLHEGEGGPTLVSVGCAPRQ